MTTNTIKVYLVGGAVRDTLLNRPVTEHDYVVVGATPQQMLDFGFSQVGADFPVFLHPKTHDEYALARTERKNGNGYLGFSVYADPSVTLEDDLIRRDLTINAMAIEVVGLFDSRFKNGKFDKTDVIDPYGGLQDIADKQLRHVSNAFAEDPVRVLRLARFASRYAPLGFGIADDTVDLVRQMRDDGELNHLVAERVWAETFKALGQECADIYFDSLDSLDSLGVLGAIMPTLSIMLIEAKYTNHWQIIAKSLRLAHRFDHAILLKFGLLSLVFIRFDNQTADMDFFKQFCQNQKIPKQYQQFGEFLLTHFKTLMQFDDLTPEQLFDLIKQSSALKDNQKLQLGLTVIQIFILAKRHILIEKLSQKMNQISIHDIPTDIRETLKGKAIGDAIDNLRMTALCDLISNDNVS